MRISALLSATAMSLALSTAAHATDGNEAYIDQTGAANSALIDQGGADNRAGRDTKLTRIRQQGDRNVLTVDQSGDRNRAGATSSGLDQLGNENEMAITQSGDGNTLTNASQFGIGGTSGSVNVLNVLQSSDGNTIGTTVQDFDGTYSVAGDGNALAITQRTGANAVGRAEQKGNSNATDILQDGTDNRVGTVLQGNFREGGAGAPVGFQSFGGFIDIDQTGNENVITLVDQEGTGQSATIVQSGDLNTVETVSQSGGGASLGNTATLDMSGNSNGGISFVAGTPATRAGVAASSVIQSGTLNRAGLTITGDSNEFGIDQTGDGNTALSMSMGGTSNELAIRQNGSDNVVDPITLDGEFNSVGIVQLDGGNFADLSIDAPGDLNDVWMGRTRP